MCWLIGLASTGNNIPALTGALGGVIAGGLFATLHSITRGGIAFGDVKLATVIGLTPTQPQLSDRGRLAAIVGREDSGLVALGRGVHCGWVDRGRPRTLLRTGEPVAQCGVRGLPREPWIVASSTQVRLLIWDCPRNGVKRIGSSSPRVSPSSVARPSSVGALCKRVLAGDAVGRRGHSGCSVSCLRW